MYTCVPPNGTNNSQILIIRVRGVWHTNGLFCNTYRYIYIGIVYIYTIKY